MSVEPISLFPVHRVDPALFAASQHRTFAGMNLRIGRSDTVHAVAWQDWISGLTLPAPSCRQGWSGLGATGELRATEQPVTCRKCRRLLGVDEPTGEQATLFELRECVLAV